MATAIACVKWGTKFGPEYVNRLARGLQRNLTRRDWTFFCFTENPNFLEMVTWPLPSDTVKGWWNKLLIFNPVVQDTAFRRYERILLLDLDKVIVGNCDFLLDVPDVELVMIKDFFYPENYGGALINLKNGCGHEVWQGFMDDMEGVVGAHFGEQVWIEKCMKGAIFYQDLHPGALASFKAHQCREGYPEGTGIVCFHGRPMPHEVEDIGWVKRCWA